MRRTLVEWTKSIAVAFVLLVIIKTFIFQMFTITSGSMEGTLLVGDFLAVSKSAYGATVPGTGVQFPGYSEPDRGDVIVFRGHHEPIDLVKRLVGMPGDTLEMRRGVLHVNGEAQEEPYVRHTVPDSDTSHAWMRWQRDYLIGQAAENASSYFPTRDNWGPIVVPENRYFVMGDNRDESLDSRYWGFVPPESIKGKAVFLYFSYDRSSAGFPVLGSIRWDRLGTLLR
ncbi:MAG: signal peptidase I [Gemmatimonadota bacterium]